MIVGVMSDSHDNLANVRRALEIFEGEKVEAVIHLGDIVAPFTLRLIGEWARERGVPVYAVYGNNCGEKLGLQRVAESLGVVLREPPFTLEIGERRLLLVHGFGSKETTREIVDALAVSNRWDAILYGHTHEPDLRRADGTLILNPGETGATLESPHVALLDLEGLWARHVPL